MSCVVLIVRAQEADAIQASVVRIMDTPRPGTGVVVAVESGVATILTAYHVIEGATKGFRVVFSASPDLEPTNVQPAEVVGTQPDATHGLAAFRVRGVPATVKAAPLSASATFAVRQDLVYWGYPTGATRLRSYGGAYSGLEGTLLLMDRSVGEGASGGPVVSGTRVVGIATATDAQTTFAVLSDVAVLSLRGWGVRLPAASSDTDSTAGTLRRENDVFRDCPECPEMVVIPAGSFTMGSPATEDERDADEGPQHRVTVPSFALGKYEVTRTQFEAYAKEAAVRASDCNTWNGKEWVLEAARSWQAPGFDQTGVDPVVCVSWADAIAYLKWLSQKTKQSYRLPSEAEWEYAARGGTTSRRWWGDSADQACGSASVADEAAKRMNSAWTVHACEDGYPYTAPVGKFRPNGFGLFDILGNVWEWSEDCYHDSYAGAPSEGQAWTTEPCDSRVLRGGSWSDPPRLSRSAERGWNSSANRSSFNGFRVARALP